MKKKEKRINIIYHLSGEGGSGAPKRTGAPASSATAQVNNQEGKETKSMAGIHDILEIEKDRKDREKHHVIHLFREGTFFRMYEWSAWMFTTRIHKYKVVHRTMRNIEGTVVMVGFPVTALDKNTPEGTELRLEANILVTGCIDEGDAAGLKTQPLHVPGRHYLALERGTALQADVSLVLRFRGRCPRLLTTRFARCVAFQAILHCS